MPQPKEILGVDHQAFYREVGRRIREARKRHKPPLTQESLAESVSLTRTSITNIEKGRQKFLLHTLAEIAAVIHVPISGLLPEVGSGSAHRLDDVLKHHPTVEKEWIKLVVTATQKGKDHDGS